MSRGGPASDVRHRRGTHLQNLAPADVTEGSELLQSLTLAVEQICKRIALRKPSVGSSACASYAIIVTGLSSFSECGPGKTPHRG